MSQTITNKIIFAPRNFSKNALHLSKKSKYQINNFLENKLKFSIVITTLQQNTKYTGLKTYIYIFKYPMFNSVAFQNESMSNCVE